MKSEALLFLDPVGHVVLRFGRETNIWKLGPFWGFRVYGEGQRDLESRFKLWTTGCVMWLLGDIRITESP